MDIFGYHWLLVASLHHHPNEGLLVIAYGEHVPADVEEFDLALTTKLALSLTLQVHVGEAQNIIHLKIISSQE